MTAFLYIPTSQIYIHTVRTYISVAGGGNIVYLGPPKVETLVKNSQQVEIMIALIPLMILPLAEARSHVHL